MSYYGDKFSKLSHKLIAKFSAGKYAYYRFVKEEYDPSTGVTIEYDDPIYVDMTVDYISNQLVKELYKGSAIFSVSGISLNGEPPQEKDKIINPGGEEYRVMKVVSDQYNSKFMMGSEKLVQ